MGSEFSANLVLKLVKVKVDIKRKIFWCKVAPVNIVCSYFVPLLQVTNSTNLLKQSNDEHNVRKLFRYMHVEEEEEEEEGEEEGGVTFTMPVVSILYAIANLFQDDFIW